MDRIKFGDVCARLSSGDSIKSDSIHESGSYPVYGANGIRGYTNAYNFDGECAIIGRQGEKCGNVGYSSGKAFMSEHAIVAQPCDGHDALYLSYLLSLMNLRKLSGQSAQPGLAVETLREIPLNMPSYEKQQRVSVLLHLLDNKIANNKKLMTELEEAARLIYDYWFTQFDFPDESGNPYRSSGGKMVFNETLHREIPVDWEVKKLDNAADVLFGYPLATTLFGEKGMPVVRIRDISDGTFSALTSEMVDETYYTDAGDLLIGMDGNFQMAFWHRKNDIVNQRISRIRKTSIPLLPLRFQIEPYIKSKVDSVARSTVGHLSNADIRDFNLAVPSAKYNLAIFDVILNTICSLQRENQSLSGLRDWLLPMLMNGQIQVGDN